MASEELHDMHAAVVVPDDDGRRLVIRFHPPEGGEGEAVTVTLPAGSVGHFVSQVAAAHQSLAMTSDDLAGSFIPLTLSGARQADAPDGTPTLLLQFDNVFELAVLLSKSRAKILARVVEHLHDKGGGASIGRH